MKPTLSISPTEEKFSFLLHQSAINIQEVARRLRDLMDDFDNVASKVREIKELEEFGDRIIHDITRALHQTAETPLDRYDILALASRLDDVIDAIDEAAQYTLAYQIEGPTDFARQLAAIIVSCADELERATALLSTPDSRLKQILPISVEINRLENEADRVASSAMGDLFSDRYDVVMILKWRDIYNDLEEATDRAEDAANVLEGIVLKHA